jgi:hypothetical protein
MLILVIPGDEENGPLYLAVSIWDGPRILSGMMHGLIMLPAALSIWS